MKEYVIAKLAPFILSLLDVSPQGSNVSLAVINFSTNTYNTLHIENDAVLPNPQSQKLFYDLASLSKPLLLASSYLQNSKNFGPQEMLLLNHRAGISPYVSYDPQHWRDQVSSLKIKESAVRYSDFSAIRLMLNLQKKNIDVEKTSKLWLDPEVIPWKMLPDDAVCPSTGRRNQAPIECDVHDPIAYSLNTFIPNAGLFATVGGVARTLLKLNNQYGMNKKMLSLIPKSRYRFLLGWEINKNLESKPAGKSTSALQVFGHRGYTGTAIWINPKLNMGIVILTNASSLENGHNHNQIADFKYKFRQKLADYIWSSFRKNR